jgi:curved DNA-binding protein CbpA
MSSRGWKEAALELGLGPRASWTDVQAAYRRLVLALHPDVSGEPGAAARFRRVSDAYRRLTELKREGEALSRVLEDSRACSLPPSELAMRLRYSGSPQVRLASAVLLGRTAGAQCAQQPEAKAARAALVAALADGDRGVRAAAAQALAAVGGPAEVARAALVAACRPAAAAAWGRAVGARALRAAAAALDAAWPARLGGRV